MKNNYYSDQFKKMGINAADSQNFKQSIIKIQLSNDLGATNHINIDFITFMQIYNALQAQNEREYNR
jgi:hypothetical protein